MEEQEKIDIRQYLINWIDIFLKDGIIPKVVNPKAIETNYVSKEVIRDKILERQFELQQEYEDFKDDIRLNTLQEIYYLNEEEK